MKVNKYALKAVSLLLVAVMGFSFTSCRKKKKTPTYGGTATVGITEAPDCLDPHKADSDAEREILINIFESLYKYNSNGELKPNLAADVAIAPDARSYTFTLKEDVRFHDGSTLDGADVAYSIMRAAGLLPGQDGTPLIPELDTVTGVTTDLLTVTVTLDAPDAELIALYTTAIIPEGSDDIETTMIGSGPFKFVSYVPGEEFTLAKNENYRKPEVPYLDTLIFKFYPDIESAFTDLQNGTIDILPYITPEMAATLDPEVFRIQSKSSNTIQIFAFNNDAEPLNDIKVRQAISYAIDRDDIITQTMNDCGQSLTTGMSPILLGPYNPSVNGTYARDIITAEALMEQAGYANGFNLTIKVSSDDQFQIDTANLIAQQLQDIDIRARVVEVDPDTFNTEVLSEGDYETAILSLTSDFDPYDVIARYDSESSDNFINYSNALVDMRIQQIPLTADTNERNELYHEILVLMTNDACSCYIQDPHYICAINKRLAGFKVFPNHVLSMSSVHLA